jgi:hypothetical protein
MTKFHLREPTLLDILIVRTNIPDDEIDQMHAFTGRHETPEDTAARLWRMPGMKWAIAAGDERAVAVGGLIEIRPGVAETWFLATQQAWVPKSNLSALVRTVKDDALTLWGWHRIETYCLASREQAHTWYTFCIGLRCEATLEGFCADGRDAKLYTAVRAK